MVEGELGDGKEGKSMVGAAIVTWCFPPPGVQVNGLGVNDLFV